ncbi:MAG TPA: TlpA disulfide reductase family protein [Candidatus Acidoferrum sp.]|nr:TlpA disulfide reductase family protein [Candidatus Acidoferrum sp.]
MRVSFADSRFRLLGALAVVSIALLGSVVINVLLAHKLHTFVHSGAVARERALLVAGTFAPPLRLKGLDGRTVELTYADGGRPTLLYIFTPSCSWCARNLDNFKALVDKESGQYRFISLSLSEEGLAEYVARNNLSVPVYCGLSPETLATYKLGNTPQTIVVSPKGKVLQDWVGAYVGEQKSQIEAFFHITLPGIRSEP